jgi:carbohydrate kinase (thermoresistant glucokinase family)
MARFVLMGVSGCGKTTVGHALSRRLWLHFIDGDDLHPQANIEKMSRGAALDDDDRAPWLRDVGQALEHASKPAAIGCSALKRKYRDLIRAQNTGDVHFIHLHAAKSVLAARVKNRPGHFMPAALLDSQYAALEHLEADETGRSVDISADFATVVTQAENYIREVMT